MTEPVQLRIDHPSDRWVQALPQKISGWIGSDAPIGELAVTVDGRTVNPTWHERPDVAAMHPNRQTSCWEFWWNPLARSEQDARVATVAFLAGGREIASVRLPISRLLLRHPGSPIFWMHIPKTAGTSLSVALAECFSDQRIIRVYDEDNGIPRHELLNVPAQYLSATKLVFGHYERCRKYGVLSAMNRRHITDRLAAPRSTRLRLCVGSVNLHQE